jgi:hypothetical protein
MPHHQSFPPANGAGRPRLEVADIFRAHGDAYRKAHALSRLQLKVMRAIETCRTQALGGHLDLCPGCGHSTPAYNSCRDRHCPKCQALRQAKWIAQRQTRLLPTHYFHVVFTVPDLLKPLARRNRARFFSLLFQAAANTLLELGQDPKRLGGQLGITAVLHTWTRDLRFHPHLHCVVTGGGLSADGETWVDARRRYLFPAKVLSRLFRGKLLAAITSAREHGELNRADFTEPGSFDRLSNALYAKDWVVYAKTPFGGPAQVFRYLGRYTHRVAISNQRLLSLDERGVCFITRGSRTKTLPPERFIARFLQHVLPRRFVKIRHFGLLAAGNVNSRLSAARRLLESRAPESSLTSASSAATAALGWRELQTLLTGVDPMRCPRCGVTLLRLPLPHPSLPPSFLDSS